MVSNNYGPNIDYGIGGAYYGGLQSSINNVTSYVSTPYPPDSYTPNYNATPNYTYQPGPQGQPYYGSQGSGQQPTPATEKATLAATDAYLDKQRSEAINQGRPDLLAGINSEQDQVNYQQQILQNSQQ
jgi:hypothetical protein